MPRSRFHLILFYLYADIECVKTLYAFYQNFEYSMLYATSLWQYLYVLYIYNFLYTFLILYDKVRIVCLSTYVNIKKIKVLI